LDQNSPAIDAEERWSSIHSPSHRKTHSHHSILEGKREAHIPHDDLAGEDPAAAAAPTEILYSPTK
jgi:hypothetical protein